MRATDITFRSYSADSYAGPGPLRLRGAWLLLSALAALALLMTVAGPSLSHHYAELTPAHSHIYLSHHIGHEHVAAGAHTHNAETPDVVNVSGDTGVSAGVVSLQIAPPAQHVLIEPHGLWHSAAEHAFVYSEPMPEPPDRPPIAA